MNKQKSTGRQSVFDAKTANWHFEDHSLPDPGTGELLIANEYVTLCRSDLKTYTGERSEKNPTVLGHEVTGRILKLGPGAPPQDERGDALNTGDRLTWAVFASAPGSKMDRLGIPQKAPDLFKYGHEQYTSEHAWHGGLATHTLLRRHTPIVKIDPSVPIKVAALVNCAVSTVAGAIRLAGSLSGKRVLISGGGTLGMFACAMAKENGAGQVWLSDPKARRLDWGRRFGADGGVFPQEVKKLTADLVIETSGAPVAMESSFGSLSIGGKAIWVGAVFPQRAVALDAEQVIRRLITIRGLHNYNRQDLITAVEFVERHYAHYPMAELVEQEYSLPDVRAAFQYGVQESPFRVGVKI